MSVPKLTLVPYLQNWEPINRVLKIRVLVVPTGNPLEPLINVSPTVPAFADANFAFAVNISDAFEALPQRTLINQTSELPDPSGGNLTINHPDARMHFEALKVQMNIPDGSAGDTAVDYSPDPNVQVKKYLPFSYRQSFAFLKSRTELASIDDTYHCLMTCPPNQINTDETMVIGWAEALAFVMRQPRLAEIMGMIVNLNVPLDAAPRLENGGWIWVDLGSNSDYFNHINDTDFFRTMATRIPALPVDATRPIFTPVVFPVADDTAAVTMLGNYDKIFVEAIRFDDGFSKIVHARQPLTSNAIDETGNGSSIVRDEGIQLAWDDQYIVEGQNRALGAVPDGEEDVLAPRGIFGYRVDVRKVGDTGWTSLSKVLSPLSSAPNAKTVEQELWSEVVPSEHVDQLWIPPWYVSWRGQSLVAETVAEEYLLKTLVPDNIPGDPNAPCQLNLEPDPLDSIPVIDENMILRYGQSYEFRVRMADTTGGGPTIDDAIHGTGERPIAQHHMLRYRHLRKLEITKSSTHLTIKRPFIGYPEALFAAPSDTHVVTIRQALLDKICRGEEALVRDSDAIYVQIRVLLSLPNFDPAADENGFIEWYTTTRRLPVGDDVALTLPIQWLDAQDYHSLNISDQLGPEGTITGSLTLVTGRDVRLEVCALGYNDLVYFGTPEARVGRIEVLNFHELAGEVDENGDSDLLQALMASDEIRSIYMQPNFDATSAEIKGVVAQNVAPPILVSRLAEALGLVSHDASIIGRSGERVVFACAGLGHYVAPDGSGIVFSDLSELPSQWISAVQIVIDRDWTWKGSGSPTLTVTRIIELEGEPSASVEVSRLGTLQLAHAVNKQAAENPQRDFTRLIFIDAFTPRLGQNGFPYETHLRYELEITLENGSIVTKTIENILPIVTPPAQLPEIVSAGVALSPYQRDDDYTRTGPRRKQLWLEFKESLADTRDTWFAKAIYRTPDPMLLPNYEPVADPLALDHPALDPELIRIITPGQAQDVAGYYTMQRLQPSDPNDPDCRHFLLPLPPNLDPDSPELFSLFTYELRAGHDIVNPATPLWSTAQGRFGEALILEGVQHPAPTLPCHVTEDVNGITVRSAYATPYNGFRRSQPNVPNTEIWAVLYARVIQADGSTYRNVQVGHKLLSKVYRDDGVLISFRLDCVTKWSIASIEEALEAAGLPLTSEFGLLAVELLPEPHSQFLDPIGSDLGQVRILRTSPLVGVERTCC